MVMTARSQNRLASFFELYSDDTGDTNCGCIITDLLVFKKKSYKAKAFPIANDRRLVSESTLLNWDSWLTI